MDAVHKLDTAEEVDMRGFVPHHILFPAYDDLSHRIPFISVVDLGQIGIKISIQFSFIPKYRNIFYRNIANE